MGGGAKGQEITSCRLGDHRGGAFLFGSSSVA